MFKEFKEFIAKGSVIDLAVGVIIGAAFGKIVTSLVDDLIMPPLGMILGKVDFKELKMVLQPASAELGKDGKPVSAEVAIRYGNFINTAIQFLILAFVIFLVVKAVNHMKERGEKPAAPAEATTKQCPFCKSDIPIAATKCAHCTADL